MKPKVIYVQQYGAWWKFTPQVWRKICEGGARGEGHMLPPACMMRKRSPLVGVVQYGDEQPTYYPLRDDVLVYSPLDWEPEDYASALKELNGTEGA